MPRPKADKSALLHAMAGHVLNHGLNTASLRPLAKAAGTSDRMLIYHFGSKDGLIAALLEHVAGMMAQGLNAALADARSDTVGACVAELVALLRTPAFQPFSNLWLDIVSASGQGAELHRAVGQNVIEGFLQWIEGRLPDHVVDRTSTARLALTLIEGILVMDAVGQSETADAAVAALSDHWPE